MIISLFERAAGVELRESPTPDFPGPFAHACAKALFLKPVHVVHIL